MRAATLQLFASLLFEITETERKWSLTRIGHLGVIFDPQNFPCHFVSINNAGNSFIVFLDMVWVQNCDKFGSWGGVRGRAVRVSDSGSEG